MSATIRMTRDRVAQVQQQLRVLRKKEILVGIPSDAQPRKEVVGEEPQPNNATIGYEMEYGVPSRNVPARPWLVPGMISVQDKAARQMVAAINAIVRPREGQVDSDGRLTAAGLVAVTGIKKYINAGIDPALSKRTLEERAARGRKGAKQELANRANIPGYTPSTALAKPLVDTAQFRNSVNYVVKFR